VARNDTAFEYSIDQAQRLFGKGLEVIGSRTGIESLYNYGREVVAKQDKDIEEGNYQPQYTMGLREAYQQGGLSDAIGWVAEKTGENIATSGIALGGGLASALTAPFSVPVAGLIGGATILGSGIVSTGEVAEEMEQQTGTYNDAVAIGAGTIMAILDRFGAGRVIPRDELLSMTGKELIKKLGEEGKVDAAREIGKRIGKSVAFEGGTEGLQEGVVMGSTALTGGEYTGEQIADRLLEGVVLGGTIGGATTTGIETLRQGPGIVNLVGDLFGPGGPTPGQQLAIQTAANLSSPGFARFKIDDAPLTNAEILMNETAGSGGPQRTPAEKAEETQNITSDDDPNIDENQFFFNKELKGGSVGNPKAQKEAEAELTKIKDIAEMNQNLTQYSLEEGLAPNRNIKGPLTSNERFSLLSETDNEIRREVGKAKNRQRLIDREDPVVSPLRIKLVKFGNKVGMKTPIDVSDLYKELRSQERNREGSVGFIGRDVFKTTEEDEVKYKPREGKGQEFGKAVKAAPKLQDGRPNYASIPNIDDLAVKVTVPKRVKKIVTTFDNEQDGKSKITHNRGGEAFTSGLEEYLARNYKEKKTMEEIIYEFDRMRPTVRLEVRSKKNKNLGADQAPFVNTPITAADILLDPSLAPPGTLPPETGYSGQRIHNSFAIPDPRTGVLIPFYDDQTYNSNPAIRGQSSSSDFEIDAISVVAHNPDHSRFASGTLTKSPITKTLKEKKKFSGANETVDTREDEDARLDPENQELKYVGSHDYYKKGFGYSRAMVVEGTDGKLYAILEELQSDITRTYENLLDFSKPEYDLALKFGGVPELLSGAIDTALKGNDPYLTRKAPLIGTPQFSDKRPIQNLSRTRDYDLNAHNLFTPSEKNKINVLDAMDQEMPDDDAPSLFSQDLTKRREEHEEAKTRLEFLDKALTQTQSKIDNFRLTERAPQEVEKFSEIALEDLIKFRKTAIPRMKKHFAKLRNILITDEVYLSQEERNALRAQFPDTAEGQRQYMEAQRERTKSVPRVFSFRQKEDEQLNKFDEMVHRTLFADGDFERFIDDYRQKLDEEYDTDADTRTGDAYFDNMDEAGSPIDRPSDLRVQQLQAFFAGATDSPAEQAIEGRLRFGKEAINSPKISRDHFGREIIRLFNEMAGFRDSPQVNSAGIQIKYIDTQTDAPTAARFRDKYERYGDRNPSFDRGGSGFNRDGVVAVNKFIKGSKNQTRAAELGHNILSGGKLSATRQGFSRQGTENKNLYEADRDVFSLIMKHMPFASKYSMTSKKSRQEMAAYDADAGPQSASRRMDAMRDAVRGAPELLQQRSFETKSLTYDFGRSKEDLEITQRVDRELENDPVRRIREDAAKILEKKSRGEYKYFDLTNDFDDDYTRVERQNTFYGGIDPTDMEMARDAFEEAFNLAVSDATYEAINEKAIETLKHNVASHLARKYKDQISKIDFDDLIGGTSRFDSGTSPKKDENGRFLAPPTFSHNYDILTESIKDLLPATAVIEAEKFLAAEIDKMADKIGFVPEDGGFRRYMNAIDRERDTEIGDQMIQTYRKKLGLDDTDKLKKKLLIESMVHRNKINPRSDTSKLDDESRIKSKRDRGEVRDNLLQRFRNVVGFEDQAKYYGDLKKILTPVPYNNFDHGNAFDGNADQDPTIGNFYQLLSTPMYRGFMEGDKDRADKLQKDLDSIDQARSVAKKKFEDTKVAENDDAEIDRRLGLLQEHIEKNAEKYNYTPTELIEALNRLIGHNEKTNSYRRTPHNASMTQTAKGLMHSLIHKVTDPRFEQLYDGRKIEGIVIPARADLYLPRAVEDGSLRSDEKRRSFGLGTYGTAVQDIIKRFEDAGAGVDRDRMFEMKNQRGATPEERSSKTTATLRRPVQAVIDLSEGSVGRRLAEGKFTFKAKGGYIDLRRKAS
jgi:hypothetical protein